MSNETERSNCCYKIKRHSGRDETAFTIPKGTFVLTPYTEEEEKLIRAACDTWRMKTVKNSYVDRTGSDHEFDYDYDDSTTDTYMDDFEPCHCIMKNGEVIGFHREVTLLIGGGSVRRSHEFDRSRNITDVTSYTYSLIRK